MSNCRGSPRQGFIVWLPISQLVCPCTHVATTTLCTETMRGPTARVSLNSHTSPGTVPLLVIIAWKARKAVMVVKRSQILLYVAKLHSSMASIFCFELSNQICSAS